MNKIAILLISLIKTTKSSNLASKAFGANNNEVVSTSSSRANITILNLSKNNKSRNLTHLLNIKVIKKFTFLISNTKKIFNRLWLAFIKAPIFQHFDPKSHIRIKTDAPSYAIGILLNQLNLDFNILPNNWNSNKSDFGQ